MTEAVIRKTHLEFYREHKISPVRYDMSDMYAHLDRRGSLYNKLGLLPISFKNANVLEVAAGTGHNSLYVSQLMPLELTLLEPNETAVNYIKNAYANFEFTHTSPNIINAQVEEFSPNKSFDIVLCENWLGTSTHELSLLKKISEMVNVNGIFVLTTIAPIGFFPNVIRRFISLYLAPLNNTFQERTALIIAGFESHLKTITAMNRSSVDWVQDNMINPAYFGLCLSIPRVLENLGDKFQAINSCPVFAEDWRWFKSLYGENRKFNEMFLSEYWKKAHNFLDYREEPKALENSNNHKLEKIALEFVNTVSQHEYALINNTDTTLLNQNILRLVDEFISHYPKSFVEPLKGLIEARDLISDTKNINPETVANMKYFSGLFGRETVYLSLLRAN